jgi:hypothetical protein
MFIVSSFALSNAFCFSGVITTLLASSILLEFLARGILLLGTQDFDMAGVESIFFSRGRSVSNAFARARERVVDGSRFLFVE